jgi:hypothetical protein
MDNRIDYTQRFASIYQFYRRPTEEEIEQGIVRHLHEPYVIIKQEPTLHTATDDVGTALQLGIFPRLNDLYSAIPRWNLWRRFQFRRDWAKRILAYHAQVRGSQERQNNGLSE